MARVVGRSSPVAEGSTGMKFSEMIIIALILAGIAAGIRYYFVQKTSATAALQNFFWAVKVGSVPKQYVLISDEDKASWAKDEDSYGKAFKAAEGFTERITNVTCLKEVPDPSDPNIVSIPTTLAIRPPSAGKELYQGGSSKNVTDTYKVRRDKDGHWKVWLAGSLQGGTLNLLQADPSPPSTY